MHNQQKVYAIYIRYLSFECRKYAGMRFHCASSLALLGVCTPSRERCQGPSQKVFAEQSFIAVMLLARLAVGSVSHDRWRLNWCARQPIVSGRRAFVKTATRTDKLAARLKFAHWEQTSCAKRTAIVFPAIFCSSRFIAQCVGGENATIFLLLSCAAGRWRHWRLWGKHTRFCCLTSESLNLCFVDPRQAPRNLFVILPTALLLFLLITAVSEFNIFFCFIALFLYCFHTPSLTSFRTFVWPSFY